MGSDKYAAQIKKGSKNMIEQRKGVWIAFEGNDGSGKSDQLERLAEYLTLEKGIGPVVASAEPGGRGGSLHRKALRGLIFDRSIADDPITQLFEFLADRRRHILENIEPDLKNGLIHLSDRSEGSAIAYQVFQYGLDRETVRFMNDYATGGLRPDLTILLDVDENIGWQRRHASKEGASNYFDNADFSDLQNRRRGYLWQARNWEKLDLNPWVVIDANRSKDEVFQDIVKVVKESRLIKELGEVKK